MEFKKYKRTAIAEMRDIDDSESIHQLQIKGVSVSAPDSKLPWEIFKKGKIARNPKNHEDQWYVAEDYFLDNFVECEKS